MSIRADPFPERSRCCRWWRQNLRPADTGILGELPAWVLRTPQLTTQRGGVRDLRIGWECARRIVHRNVAGCTVVGLRRREIANIPRNRLGSRVVTHIRAGRANKLCTAREHVGDNAVHQIELSERPARRWVVLADLDLVGHRITGVFPRAITASPRCAKNLLLNLPRVGCLRCRRNKWRAEVGNLVPLLCLDSPD